MAIWSDRRRQRLDEADLALDEHVDQRGPVGRARVGLGGALVDHLLHERHRLVGLRGVDGELVAVAPAAAGAEGPDGGLGLRLLVAERHAVAADAATEVADRLARCEQVVPGRGDLGDAGLLEQVGVDEHRAGRRDQRQAVLGAVDRGVLLEGVLDVVQGLGGDDLVGRVEQVVGREAGERVDVEDVGRLVGLHLGADHVVDVVPRLDLEVDLDVGVLGLEVVDDAFPEGLGAVAVRRDQQVDACWRRRRSRRRRRRRRSRSPPPSG